MERKHWTLLAVAAAGGDTVSPVHLQKTLFLLGENMRREVGRGFYRFRPYNYGPFAVEVYQDAESLARDGLVAIEYQPGRRWPVYRATVDGLKQAEYLKRSANARCVAYLQTVVDWARRLDFAELVRSIYASYPEYRVNSVFQEP